MLESQLVSVPFAAGVDTKSDPRSLSFGPLLSLENGVFTRTGSISKRRGYTALSRRVEGSSTQLDEADNASVFGEELLCFSEGRGYSWLESTDHWSDRGLVHSVVATDTQIIRNTYQQSNPDVARLHGLRCVVWEDTRGGVRYSIADDTTGAAVVFDTSLHATAIKPKAVAFGDEFVVFYTSGANLYYRRINALATPTTLGSEQTLSSGLDAANNNYDVTVLAGKIYYAANTAALRTDVGSLDGSFTASLSATFADISDRSVSIFGDDNGVFVVTADSGLAVTNIRGYTLLLTVRGVAATIDALNAAVRSTGVAVSDTEVRVVYEIAGSSASNARLAYFVINPVTNTVTTASTALVRSVGLAGKAFVASGAFYFVTVHESTLQSTYFVMDSTGRVVARLAPTTSGGLRSRCTLSEVPEVGDSVFEFAGQVKGELLTETSTAYAQKGVNVTTIDFTSSDRFMSAAIDRNLVVAGGLLHNYDGVSFTEHGFHLYPEGTTASVGAGGGGLTNGKTYSWRVVYEWIDAFGQFHRSAPGLVTISGASTYTSAAGNETVTLTIPTLRVTAKSNVRIVVYRTEGNQPVYYRVSSITSPTFNSTTTDTVTYADTAADTAITGNEVLYTEGGVLENIAPGACSIVCGWKGRVFLAGLSDPHRVAYSTQTVPGEAVSFNDSLTIDVDPAGGPITALGAIDDKLVIFKRDTLMVVTGDGPTNTGDLNDYGDPVVVATDVGCDSPRSVVVTPVGLMFKSRKGIYLLDRSLNVTYVGAPVESFNDQSVVAAVLVPERNEVRFLCEEEHALVFNYLVGQWSTFTGHATAGACMWRDQFVFVKTNGTAMLEAEGVWSDGGDVYTLKLTTAWLQVAGVQGYQRIKRAWLLGDYKGRHTLQVHFGYDHSDAWSQVCDINAYSILDTGTYGSVSPYGSDAYYGGAFPLYQFGIHLAQQKCTAIRVRIEEAQTQTGGFTEGLSLSNVCFLVGVKRGGPKLPSARSLGSSAA